MGKAEPKKKHYSWNSAFSPWQPWFVRHNYTKFEFSHLILFFIFFIDVFKFLETNSFLHLFIPLVPSLFLFNFVIIGKNDILTSWNRHEVQTGGFDMTDVLKFMTF